MRARTSGPTGTGRRRAARSGAPALLLALSLALTGGARSVGAQSVRGTVVDAPTGEPLVGAFVGLVDTTGTTAAATLSDSTGSFRLGRPAPGSYRLRVARADLDAWTSEPFRVRAGGLARRFEVARGGAGERFHRRLRERCEARLEEVGDAPRGADGGGDAILFGQVRDEADGLSVPEARVFWGSPEGGKPSLLETGPTGAFLLCGLPSGKAVELQASAPGLVGRPVRLRVPDRPLLVQDLLVSAAALAGIEEPGADGTATLRGRVRSAETGEPVSGARVLVLETGDERVAGPDGTFVIPGLPRRTLRVVTERVGNASDTVRVRLGAGSVTVALLTLETAPVELPALRVEVERTLENPRLTGYYERLDRRAIGDFITREELERTDLIFSFRRLLGVRVEQCVSASGLRETGCWRLDMSRGHGIGRGTCRPVVYLDGARILGDNPFEILRSYPRALLEGIEVYRGLAGAPAQYRPIDAACGVVLAWTRGRR